MWSEVLRVHENVVWAAAVDCLLALLLFRKDFGELGFAYPLGVLLGLKFLKVRRSMFAPRWVACMRRV